MSHRPSSCQTAPSRANSIVSRGKTAVVLAVFAGQGTVGCLAFKDFELEVEGSEATGRACDNEGQYDCSRKDLWQCRDGILTYEYTCGSLEYCNDDLGKCTSCRPGVDAVCQGGERGQLSVCTGDGEDYDVIDDCGAQDRVCAAEQSPSACVDCVAGQGRCGKEDTLLKCSRFEFLDSTRCELGCVVVDDLHDYCAECDVPGTLACFQGSLDVCNESFVFESYEECPNGCDATGAIPKCADSSTGD